MRHPVHGLLLATLLLCGCSQKPPEVAESKPEEVTVSEPISEEITDYDDYSGRIEAKETVDVQARVRGHLMKISFKEGEEVRAGDPLFEIDPRPYKMTLEQAEATLAGAEAAHKLATLELARVRQLTSKGAASREEQDVIVGKQGVATAEMLKARAAVEQAKLDLDFTKIVSPISGRVGEEYVSVGNLVNAVGGETTLTNIVSLDPIYVYFSIDERSLLRYERQDVGGKGPDKERTPVKDLKIPVAVALDGEAGFPHKGFLDFADNKVDRATGTILVRGVLPNQRRQLLPGLRAQVRIPVSAPYRALLVNERALGTDQGLRFLLVVNKDNVVDRRDVRMGTATSDGLRVVQAGLRPEEWVIVNNLQRVRPGMTVDPKAVPMPRSPAGSGGVQNSAPPKASPTPGNKTTDNSKAKS